MIDPILLDVVCPFLKTTGLDRVVPIGRMWNRPVDTDTQRASAPRVQPLRVDFAEPEPETRLSLVIRSVPASLSSNKAA